MRANTAILPAPVSESALRGERRRSPRSKLPCFILIRPFEPGPDYFESIVLTDDSSRQGLAFGTDNPVYCERMRLLLTFPFLTHPGAINRDYIAEVTRRDVLPEGQYSVAVRFLTTAKLTVPPPSALHATEIWSMLLRCARAGGPRRLKRTA
jgi:hypothetical protein